MESARCTPPKRQIQIDAWGWGREGVGGVGRGVGPEPGQEAPPHRTFKGFHSACPAFWDWECLPFGIQVLPNGMYFSYCCSQGRAFNQPRAKHTKKWDRPPPANEKSLISKTPGCYYLDARTAGTNSERRMIHCHGY